MSPIELTTSVPLRKQPSEARRDLNSNSAAQGRHSLDLSGSRRLPILMEMVGELSRATDPKQVLRAFGEGLIRLDGPRGYISLSVRGLKPGEYKITRFHTGDSVMNIDANDPWKEWNSMPVLRGGLLGELIRKAYPEVIHNLYLRNDPVLGDSIAQYGSMMAIPLFEHGEPLNWAITLRDDPEGFSVKDLEDSVLRSNLGGATVRNVMITKQLREANERIEHEIDNIAKIQRTLLPLDLPQIPGLSIATSYETFDTAGGDLYDLTVLPTPPDGPTRFDGWVAMVIADASGHGPASAVMTAMFNTLLYAYPRKGKGPGDVFEFANRHLCSKRIEGTFITAFLAVYNPADHTLIYARAGHNPPLIKNPGAGRSVFRLDDIGGIPLGVVDDARFEDGIVTLKPGQTLVMYTDGITEAMNPQREMFGVEGIERALHECSGEPACVVNSINTALKIHQSGVRPSDDQTIVAVKVE